MDPVKIGLGTFRPVTSQSWRNAGFRVLGIKKPPIGEDVAAIVGSDDREK